MVLRHIYITHAACRARELYSCDGRLLHELCEMWRDAMSLPYFE